MQEVSAAVFVSFSFKVSFYLMLKSYRVFKNPKFQAPYCSVLVLNSSCMLSLGRVREKKRGRRTHCASKCNLISSDMLLCGSQDQHSCEDLKWTWRVSCINRELRPRWRCWLKIKRPEACVPWLYCLCHDAVGCWCMCVRRGVCVWKWGGLLYQNYTDMILFSKVCRVLI